MLEQDDSGAAASGVMNGDFVISMASGIVSEGDYVRIAGDEAEI